MRSWERTPAHLTIVCPPQGSPETPGPRQQHRSRLAILGCTPRGASMKLLALQHGAPPLMARRLALRSPRNPTSPAVQGVLACWLARASSVRPSCLRHSPARQPYPLTCSPACLPARRSRHAGLAAATAAAAPAAGGGHARPAEAGRQGAARLQFG